jgi:hypothetical protein
MRLPPLLERPQYKPAIGDEWANGGHRGMQGEQALQYPQEQAHGVAPPSLSKSSMFVEACDGPPPSTDAGRLQNTPPASFVRLITLSLVPLSMVRAFPDFLPGHGDDE